MPKHEEKSMIICLHGPCHKRQPANENKHSNVVAWGKIKGGHGASTMERKRRQKSTQSNIGTGHPSPLYIRRWWWHKKEVHVSSLFVLIGKKKRENPVVFHVLYIISTKKMIKTSSGRLQGGILSTWDVKEPSFPWMSPNKLMLQSKIGVGVCIYIYSCVFGDSHRTLIQTPLHASSSHHPAHHSRPPRCYICSHFLFHLFLVCLSPSIRPNLLWGVVLIGVLSLPRFGRADWEVLFILILGGVGREQKRMKD